jgi:Transglutaminase-like superfamily
MSSVASVIVAWWLLVSMDLIARLLGFARLYAIIAACPTLPLRAGDVHRVHETCVSVNRARGYYFKHAWCLQAAATTTCLLRLRGIAADFVVGVRKMPFEAHAWVEVDHQIVMNAKPNLRALYSVITRC